MMKSITSFVRTATERRPSVPKKRMVIVRLAFRYRFSVIVVVGLGAVFLELEEFGNGRLFAIDFLELQAERLLGFLAIL
jgi:hypothetical protein